MKLDAFRRWGALLLALAMLFTSIHTDAANAPASNQADVQLKTDLTHMVIQINQGAPLPPGGCNAGYAWHTVFGGCRRAIVQSEAGACPAGYIGNTTRYRNAYVLQANAADIAYDPWGAWQTGCSRARATGVVDELLAVVRGLPNGEIDFPSNLTGNIAKQMLIDTGTLFGVVLDKSTASLICVYASGTSSGGGESNNGFVWNAHLFSPGESVNKDPFGHCLLSSDNQTAQISANCDSTTGGDNAFCVPGSKDVRITSVSDCTVVLDVDGQGSSYDICQ